MYKWKSRCGCSGSKAARRPRAGTTRSGRCGLLPAGLGTIHRDLPSQGCAFLLTIIRPPSLCPTQNKEHNPRSEVEAVIHEVHIQRSITAGVGLRQTSPTRSSSGISSTLQAAMEAPLPKQDTNELYLTVPLLHGRCTRIIELLDAIPGEASHLQLRLSVSDVNKWDEHEDGPDTGIAALSYTWGPPFSTPECEAEYGPEHDVWIQITTPDDQLHAHRIRRNLYDALVNIRASRMAFKYLWVDALCINQYDLEEKAQQVLLMDKIYSKASMVISWIGVRENSPKSMKSHIARLLTNVIPKLDDYMKGSGECTGGSGERNYSDIHISLCGPLGSPTHLHFEQLELNIPVETMRALYHLFASCRYFARAWILQEIVLSKKCVLLLGNQHLDFQTLTRLPHLFRTRDLVNALFLEPGQVGAHGSGQELATLDFLRAWLHDPEPTREQGNSHLSQWLSEYLFRAELGESTPFAMLEFLLQFGHQKLAIDPRDIIYSVLPLVSANLSLQQPIIRPDYTISAEDLYIDVTKTLLLKVPRMSTLSFASASSTGLKLPSWVPDYSHIKSRGTEPISTMCYLMQQESFHGFEAAGRFRHCSLAFDGRNLKLQGLRCCQIRSVFKPFPNPFSDGDLAGRVRARTEVAIFFLTTFTQALGTEYPTGESPLEATFRAIDCSVPSEQNSASVAERVRFWFLDMLCDSAMFHSDNEDIFDLIYARAGEWGIPVTEEIAWARGLSDRLKNNNLEERDIALAAQMARGKSAIKYYSWTNLFIDERGYVGWTWNDVKVGDEVWLICGAKVPFILRATEQEEDEYQIIGETLVHGAMFGEWVAKGIAGEVRDITIV